MCLAGCWVAAVAAGAGSLEIYGCVLPGGRDKECAEVIVQGI